MKKPVISVSRLLVLKSHISFIKTMGKIGSYLKGDLSVIIAY